MNMDLKETEFGYVDCIHLSQDSGELLWIY